MMTNDDRDKIIMEMHADIKTLLSKVADHGKTLYGNGVPGVLSRVQAVEQRQTDCPARLAAIEGRTASVRQGWLGIIVSIISLCIAGLAIVVSLK